MPRTTVIRKRRTGIWHSQGHGSGTVQKDSGWTSTSDSDDDDLDTDDLDNDDDIESLRAKAKQERAARKKSDREAKRRRLQLKEERSQRNSGGGPEQSDQSVLMRFVTTMAKSPHQLHDPEAFVSLVRTHLLADATEESNMDEILDEALERFPYFIKIDKSADQHELPGTGSRHNGNKNRSKAPSNQQLANKYTALRHTWGRS